MSGLKLAGLGIEFAATILGALFLGHLVDRRLGWDRPWGLIAGALLGLLIGLFRLALVSQKHNR